MRGIEYLILRLGLFLLFVVISSPLALLLGWLVAYLETQDQLQPIIWCIAVSAVVYFIGLGWLANQIAQHMAFENRRFGSAVKCSLYDIKLRLAFLPLVGQWFTPKKRRRGFDPDDAD